jgi:hypothetical protein
MDSTGKDKQESILKPAVGKGLTSKRRELLEKTMHRHDKAFKKLAQM